MKMEIHFFVSTTSSDNQIKFNSNSECMFSTFTSETGDFKFNQIEDIDFGIDVIDTSSVTSMKDMFYGCNSLKSLDLSEFDTSNVSSMEGMFCECYSLEEIIFGNNFSSSSLINTKSMFANCWVLNQISLPSGFTCAKVSNMKKMFSTCLSLSTLDLSDFDTSSATNADRIFQGCISLVRIYADENKQYFSSASSDNMFWNCALITGHNGTSYDEDHLDKTYARIDDPDNDNPGYFTKKDIVKKGIVYYDTDKADFIDYYSGSKVEGISYNPSTKVVTMNGLNLDSNVEHSYALELPSGTKEIVVKGHNVINDININNEYSVLAIEGSENNQNFKFTGDGTLILNETNFECALFANKLIVNGPTLNVYANTVGEKNNAAVVANSIMINGGKINTFGSIGLALTQIDSPHTNSLKSVPSLIVNGGSINAYGTYAAFGESLLTNNAVTPFASVKGSTSLIDDELTSNMRLVTQSVSSPYVYAYFDPSQEDLVRHVVFTSIGITPSPSKKDESCEKVIGPTWHWNNTKGICEDYGVVGTFTR